MQHAATRRSRGIAAVLAAASLIVTACGPPPPAAPTWTITRLARTSTTSLPLSTVNQVGAWTSDAWFATLRLDSPAGSSPSATLQFFPRTGPGGATLGAPYEVAPSVDPSIVGPLGAGGIVGLGGSSAVEVLRLDGGVWSSIGSVALPPGRFLAAMTDRWMVFRPGTPPVAGVDSTVVVYALDTSGPAVVATPAATLGPDPAWPAELREGFGTNVAIDGDLLAVSATPQAGGVSAGGRVFRAAPGWTPVASVGGGTGGPVQLGQGLAVDDGATVDRIAVQVRATDTALPTVEIYADTGGGFLPEASLLRDPTQTDTYGGAAFGAAIGLDGDLLALTARGVATPSAQPGHPDVTVGRVQLFRLGAGWTLEAEVGDTLTPAPAGVTSLVPGRLHVADGHVAANVFVSPDPPVGCTFPCFVFGFESWSIDRAG